MTRGAQIVDQNMQQNDEGMMSAPEPVSGHRPNLSEHSTPYIVTGRQRQ